MKSNTQHSKNEIEVKTHRFEIDLNAIILKKQVITVTDWETLVSALSNMCEKHHKIIIDADKEVFALSSGFIYTLIKCAKNHINDNTFYIHIDGSEEFIHFMQYMICDDFAKKFYGPLFCPHFIFFVKS